MNTNRFLKNVSENWKNATDAEMLEWLQCVFATMVYEKTHCGSNPYRVPQTKIENFLAEMLDKAGAEPLKVFNKFIHSISSEGFTYDKYNSASDVLSWPKELPTQFTENDIASGKVIVFRGEKFILDKSFEQKFFATSLDRKTGNVQYPYVHIRKKGGLALFTKSQLVKILNSEIESEIC